MSVSAPASNPFGDLTTATGWTSLYSDPAKLKQWVISQAPQLFAAKPDLADYYVSHIQEKPGANDTEKAGSAAYWTGRITSDPNYAQYDGRGATTTGTPSAGGSANSPTPGTVLGTASAASQPAYGPGAVPPTKYNPAGYGKYQTAPNGGVGQIPTQNQAQATAAAMAAANRTRLRNGNGGRSSTIIGGFAGGSPTIGTATILGRSY